MIHQRWCGIAEGNDDVALVEADRHVSFRELLEIEGDLASELQRRGVEAGDAVLAQLPNGLEFAASFLATARLGAVLVPVNPKLLESEISHYHSRIAPRVALSVESFPRERRRQEGVGRSARRDGGPYEGEAVFLSTSGSTGLPKIVPRTHTGLLFTVSAVASVLGLRSKDRFLGVAPFHHAHGFVNSLVLSLLSGACLATVPRFVPRATIELVRRLEITAILASPFVFAAIAESLEDGSELPSLRVCVSGGAALPTGVRQGFLDKTGLHIRELYGCSEAGTIGIQREGEVCAFRPNPGVDVRIVDESGGSLAAGSVGEVAARSPTVTPGYVGAGGAVDRFVDGYLLTGDFGYLDESGELILQGRKIAHLNVAGVKVDPVEIEKVLQEIPGVEQAYATAAPGPRGLEAIKAVIALRDGVEVSRRSILSYCRERLSEHKLPRLVEFVDRDSGDILGKARRVEG